jgi:hypothetical protein
MQTYRFTELIVKFTYTEHTKMNLKKFNKTTTYFFIQQVYNEEPTIVDCTKKNFHVQLLSQSQASRQKH